MTLAVDRAVQPDNGWRNYLRRVPPDCVLYYPGLRGGGTNVVDYSGQATDCTIVGATWLESPAGPWLLSYDGDDYCRAAVANFRNGDSSGAIEMWFRSSSKVAKQALFVSSDEGTDTSYFFFFIDITSGKLRIEQRSAAGAATNPFGSTDVTDGIYHHVVLSSSGTAYTIIVDGVDEGALTGANDGDWFADTALRDNIAIGALVRTGVGLGIIGDIGLTRVYSRPMLVPEAKRNFNLERRFLGR